MMGEASTKKCLVRLFLLLLSLSFLPLNYGHNNNNILAAANIQRRQQQQGKYHDNNGMKIMLPFSGRQQQKMTATTSKTTTAILCRGGGANDDASTSVSIDPEKYQLPSSIAEQQQQQEIISQEEPQEVDSDDELLEVVSQPSTSSSASSYYDVTTPKEKKITAPSKIVLALNSPKMKNFAERLWPAVMMLAGVGAWTYYTKEDGLIAMTFGLQAGMYHEVCQVVGGSFSGKFRKWFIFVVGGWMGMNLPRLFPWAQLEITTLTYSLGLLSIISTIVGFNRQKATVEDFREYLREAAVCLLSLTLVVYPSSFWISTLEEFGMKWVLYSVILVIINDTMAYVFGMTMGKHALLPEISPKKTWEGFIGAAISTVAAAWFWLLPEKHQRQDALWLSLLASLVGPFGGFLASVIKRAYRQKDFGALFPGHGGFVDRLDCQVLLAPFVYLYLCLSRKQSSNNVGAGGGGGSGGNSFFSQLKVGQVFSKLSQILPSSSSSSTSSSNNGSTPK